jgi:hypothetical protein
MDLQSEICETVEEKIQSGIHKISGKSCALCCHHTYVKEKIHQLKFTLPFSFMHRILWKTLRIFGNFFYNFFSIFKINKNKQIASGFFYSERAQVHIVGDETQTRLHLIMLALQRSNH